jgi:uncharacterized CHY-type Zn-finger protein
MDLSTFLKKVFTVVKRFLSMVRSTWHNFPEQIKRLTILAVIVIIGFLFARQALLPPDFGTYGHYRSSAVEKIVQQPVQYAGHIICAECHDDISDLKYNGYHKNVNCEVCHGPAFSHTEDDEIIPTAPRERGFCPLCHEYLPSRPTGFPQIKSASHNPMKPCISCHNPHDPKPQETPKACGACHQEIVTTKSLSKHIYIDCTECHTTPEQHKINPREVRPTKPSDRAFCGKCHSLDADGDEDIPRIDLATHEEAYVCWQCHYPHLPEVQ